jgi:hypothetical protein
VIHYTIGVGGDYADFNSAVNALAAILWPGLTDDYEFEVISNLTNSTAYSGGVVYLNYHTVKFYSSVPHLGNPLKGNIITCTRTATIATAQSVEGRGTLIFEDLYFKANPGFGSELVRIQVAMEFFEYIQWKTRKTVIKNCMFDGNGTAQISLKCASAEYSLWELSNLKIWGHQFWGLNFGYSGILVNPGETSKFIENVIIFNDVNGSVGMLSNGLGDSGGDDTYYKNVISCRNGATGSDWFTGMQAARCIVDNCASSDATCPVTFGSNNLRNIVTVNEFESLDDTNPNFLKLNNGQLVADPIAEPDRGVKPLRVRFTGNIDYVWPSGQIYNAGTIPALTINDIAGAQYGRYGYYPIGCHNAEIVY